jgi:Rad3-related DNA helicase
MMDKAIQALKSEHNVLLELPTGSGKSLSLLCAASAWIEMAEKEMKQEQGTDSSGKDTANSSRQMNSAAVESIDAPRDHENDFGSGSADNEGGFISGHATDGQMEAKAKRPPRVYFASRTHSQIEQLVREMRKTAYR